MRPGLAALLCALGCGVVQAQTEQTQQLNIVDGVLPAAQRVVTVFKGDQLRWRISSNAAGEVHLHAYRLVATVQPGQGSELAFSAHATGRFRVEWHAASASAVASAPRATHHGPPLLTLEVRPR